MKKNKIFIAALSIVMTICFANIGVFAKQIRNINDSYSITTSIGEEQQIIRVFERSNDNVLTMQSLSLSEKENYYSEIKSILLELGMEQYAIENLTEKDLERLSISPKIITSVSYSKVDSENNMTYLDEDVAVKEAEAINKKQESYKNNVMNGVQTLNQGTTEDSYMRVFYMVTYHWDESYTFSTDSRWLTMPFFRGKDVIGSVAQNCTVTPNTGSGYVEYDWSLSTIAGVNEYSDKINMTSSQFQNTVNGNFYGSGAIIDLPNDTYSDNMSTTYRNYKAHYQYDGHINNPSSPQWFNTTGSYCHSTIKVSVKPSITISLIGVSGSLGLSGVGGSDVRKVDLEIHYT